MSALVNIYVPADTIADSVGEIIDAEVCPHDVSYDDMGEYLVIHTTITDEELAAIDENECDRYGVVVEEL